MKTIVFLIRLQSKNQRVFLPLNSIILLIQLTITRLQPNGIEHAQLKYDKHLSNYEQQPSISPHLYDVFGSNAIRQQHISFSVRLAQWLVLKYNKEIQILVMAVCLGGFKMTVYKRADMSSSWPSGENSVLSPDA